MQWAAPWAPVRLTISHPSGLRRRPASSFGWQLEESVGQTVEIHVSDKEQNIKNPSWKGGHYVPRCSSVR